MIDEPDIPQQLPGDETYKSPYTDSEVANFKAAAVGYDPVGGGDKCTCGGNLVTIRDGGVGSPATMRQKCSTCGKDPASFEPSGKDILVR